MFWEARWLAFGGKGSKLLQATLATSCWVRWRAVGALKRMNLPRRLLFLYENGYGGGEGVQECF